MTKLGNVRSGEAIAKSMVPYIACGGTFEDEEQLKRDVYFMGETIEEDRVAPRHINDLGISQTARLWQFLNKSSGSHSYGFPDFAEYFGSEYFSVFDGFPTIGAEFHSIPPNSPSGSLRILRRLVPLNMSQYQRGSFIPFSRIDKGVLEIRMNPSLYPFTVANWNLMRQTVPDVNNQYFTVCIGKEEDFERASHVNTIIPPLISLGNIIYSLFFTTAPEDAFEGEYKFGEHYIGQTVRLKKGSYSLDGTAPDNGQLNLYVGFGESFPYHVYYLSMAVAEPELLTVVQSEVGGGLSPVAAVRLNDKTRRHIVRTMNDYIMRSPRLAKAAEYDLKIIDSLAR